MNYPDWTNANAYCKCCVSRTGEGEKMQDIQSVSSEQIRSDAKKLKKEGRAFIGGEYVASLSGKTFQCVSPVDGQAVVDIASCDKEDVDRAVQSCRQAFEDRRCCSKSPSQRKCIMLELANLIRKNRQELAVLETLDMGKPIKESFNTDIPLAADCIQWFAEAIDKIYDEIAPTPETSLAMITREPLGVVAAVIPWNFPLLMAAWKLGPALAAGNSVLIKPAEQSSLTAIRLGALCIEAGIPEGVVNIVPGLGENAGKGQRDGTDRPTPQPHRRPLPRRTGNRLVSRAARLSPL